MGKNSEVKSVGVAWSVKIVYYTMWLFALAGIGYLSETLGEAFFVSTSLISFAITTRTAFRSAILEADGIKIRSFFKTYHVKWPEILELEARDPLDTWELDNLRLFVKLRIKFVSTNKSEKKITISININFDKNYRDSLIVTTWSPLGHPLRESLPNEVQSSTSTTEINARPVDVEWLLLKSMFKRKK